MRLIKLTNNTKTFGGREAAAARQEPNARRAVHHRTQRLATTPKSPSSRPYFAKCAAAPIPRSLASLSNNRRQPGARLNVKHKSTNAAHRPWDDRDRAWGSKSTAPGGTRRASGANLSPNIGRDDATRHQHRARPPSPGITRAVSRSALGKAQANREASRPRRFLDGPRQVDRTSQNGNEVQHLRTTSR